jgi:hypothetical protein
MRFDAEQKRHIEVLIERRLVRDRAARARDVAHLIAERDRLAVELAALRVELKKRSEA